MRSVTRRDFLKLGGMALASMAFTSFLPEVTEFEDMELVRVAKDPVSVYERPDDTSRIIRTWERDSLVHVYATVDSGTPGYNPIWYRVFGGYMHRARLQKVAIQYNLPLTSIPAEKVLAELTVPFTDSYRNDPWDGWYIYRRLYYSSTQWITGLQEGPDKKPWYVVQDESDKNINYLVPAVQLRPIPKEDMSAINPQVSAGNKRIDVNLTSQTLECYEGDVQVFTTKVSSGVMGMETPAGVFHINDKLPSRNMSTTSRLADDIIPLVGVPWCSFFTEEGHAFHGTYWHDNFGVPMSHGCVNMRNEDARWLFRWNTPLASFDEINKQTLDVRGYGTRVEIHY